MKYKKISSAMKRGAALSKAVVRAWVEKINTTNKKEHPLQACAVGAAMIGVESVNGFATQEWEEALMSASYFHHKAQRLWPWMAATTVGNLPVDIRPDARKDRLSQLDVFSAVIVLNDDCCWPREKIADWLAKVEEHLGITEEIVDAEFDASLVK